MKIKVKRKQLNDYRFQRSEKYNKILTNTDQIGEKNKCQN